MTKTLLLCSLLLASCAPVVNPLASPRPKRFEIISSEMADSLTNDMVIITVLRDSVTGECFLMSRVYTGISIISVSETLCRK